MDKLLEKLKYEIENQTSSKIIKQIKVTPIFYKYMIKSVGIYGTFGKNVDISFLGCPIIIDEKLEKHFEIEYIEKGGWNELNAFITLYLMLEGAKDEQGNRICPLCRQVKLDEQHFLLCEKCEKEKIDIYKEKSNMKKLLVVVDMQNDFINGSLGTKEAQAIVPKVLVKTLEYRANGHDIIFTRDTHNTDYLNTQEGKNLPVEHCIKGTEGWQIADVLNADKMATYSHIDKPSFGFTKWNLYNALAEYDEIEIVGLCTDICVISNALLLKAFYPEIKITVDASCCAGVTPQSHKNALEAMKMCQINIIGE